MTEYRRNDYDVTNSVQVSSTSAVKAAVSKLFAGAFPGGSFERAAIAFDDFERLFTGEMPGYHGVDTVYHDLQHSLDMTLATARMLAAHELTARPETRFGADRATMAIIVSLFHDAGYIRSFDDHEHRNGAEFTLYHVARGARFLSHYLPGLGLAEWVPVATRVIHYTGYEIALNKLDIADWRDRRVGQILGTADLIAQMSDRCYLEKCRDRLYPEFVLGGIAAAPGTNGTPQVKYSSGVDLLRQTPQFAREARERRLDGEFESVYRSIEVLFDGRNPYLEAIERNLAFLERVLRSERWPLLRRNPPLFTSEENQMGEVRGLMVSRLKVLWA